MSFNDFMQSNNNDNKAALVNGCETTYQKAALNDASDLLDEANEKYCFQACNFPNPQGSPITNRYGSQAPIQTNALTRLNELKTRGTNYNTKMVNFMSRYQDLYDAELLYM